jgi:hypothetical protein
MDELKKDGDKSFDKLQDTVIEILLSDKLRPLAVTRAWLLELFVRGVVPISLQKIRSLDQLTETLDQRQLFRLRHILNDQNFFRRRKTRVSELNAWLQPSFIMSARCLPKDEYKHWVQSVKSRLGFPLAPEFCDWCIELTGA